MLSGLVLPPLAMEAPVELGDQAGSGLEQVRNPQEPALEMEHRPIDQRCRSASPWEARLRVL